MKIDEEKKSMVKAMRRSGESYRKCAEAAQISETSARKICMEETLQDKAEWEAEEKGKSEFVKNAWEIINGSMGIIKDRIRMAECDLKELMEIIKNVIDGKELSGREKNKLVYLLEKQAKEYTVPSLKELSGVVSAMYDRQRLAQGEATEITGLSDDDRKLLTAVAKLDDKK